MSSRNDTVDELSTKYIKSLRDQCMKKGIQGIKGLGTIFRSMDNDYTRRLNLDEFKRGMRVYGLDIDDESLTRMFNKFDRDGNSVVDFEEFLAQLRPPMAQCRVDVVNQAFDKLDVTKDGLLMVDDLTGTFSKYAERHPKYQSGEWSQERVLESFIETFDTPGNPDGKVTRDEFLNYYAGVSSTVDEDEYFDMMMRSCWGLPSKKKK
ncbi:unnamed protein product [Owenia fusiformis]|uniref:Uncharacterized protein n=1 Tax=Owenia fusiformis TaxID=6347 RepID=A0A8J1XYD2_OWEFU|nr:unnamed protein product [Owenia fusiformis]